MVMLSMPSSWSSKEQISFQDCLDSPQLLCWFLLLSKHLDLDMLLAVPVLRIISLLEAMLLTCAVVMVVDVIMAGVLSTF